jgi:FG-GAP-like repeat/Bacterial Ig-like domain (group 3)
MKTGNHGVYALAAGFLLSLLATFSQTAAATTTATTLKITSGDARAASVLSGTVVTLTATVKSKAQAVTVGQISFCEADAKTCTDIHLLGRAQLTAAGTAVMKFVPGIGKHSYKAVFAGTPNGKQDYAGSTSRNSELSVTGKFATATSITETGSAGDYTLTATVSGLVNAATIPAPAGKVSFLDTTDANHALAKAMLGPGTAGLNFVQSNTPGTNPYPQSVAVADFNGDGRLDLAVPVYSIFTPQSDANVFLGNGDGTFTAAAAFPASGQNANNFAVADFNGDGKPDLAMSLPDANQIQILLGNGDGSFTPMTPISVSAIFVVATGDFNGDGIADLAVVGYGSSSVDILLGNGDGTFKPGATIPVAGPFAVAVADYNGDGIADLAVVNGGSDTVTIFLGNGDGTFTAVASTPSTGVEPLSITAGDFNGDGILDLAVSNQNDGYPNPGTVTVLLGKGDGTFKSAPSLQSGSIPYTVTVADVNGDGIADLITGNAGSNTASVFLGNGDGTFAAPLSPPIGTNPVGAAVADFNGDGIPDLAAANNTTTSVTIMLTAVTQTATAVASGVAPKGSGQHAVDASYKGNAKYQGSVSSTVTLTGNSEAIARNTKSGQ